MGDVRDGIQRNVEVMLVQAPRSEAPPRISRYPSSSLVSAVRCMVLMEGDETQSLIAAADDIVRNVLSTSLDMKSLVDKFGLEVRCFIFFLFFFSHILVCLKVWSKSLWKLCLPRADEKLFLGALLTWDSTRPKSWDTDLESYLLKQLPKDFSSHFVDGKKIEEEVQFSFWTCPKCKFDQNSSHLVSCQACSSRRSSWCCGGCTANNLFGAMNCVACGMNSSESFELFSFNRKEEKRKKVLMKQKKITELAEFPHPGTISDCGGNPRGFAQCNGEGVCSSSCVNCGRGTHWSCCGSNEIDSINCINGISATQATANATLLRALSINAIRCCDVKGVVFPGEKLNDWSCSV